MTLRGLLGGLMLLLVATAMAVEAEPLTWMPGDAWTWSKAGAVGGDLSARVVAGEGGLLRTLEVERTSAGEGLDVQSTNITRSWAGAFRLASEERVTVRCLGQVLGALCGAKTERWTYEPPLDLVRQPLAANDTWSQELSVHHTVHDELAPAGDVDATEQVVRHVRVRGPVNVSTGLGALEGWDIVLDTEAADSDGAWESWVYAPSVAQLATRARATGFQEQPEWVLETAELAARPPPSAPPGASAPPGTPSSPVAPPTTGGSVADPTPAKPTPGPAPRTTGPPAEHPLRAPGAPELGALAVIGLAALALRRR